MNNIAAILRESKLARFFIPAGLILIVFGIAVFIINQKNQNYVKTEATVTKAELEQEAHTDEKGNRTEATYNISVKYSVDGKDYEAGLSGLPEKKSGEKMTIYYNPDDPAMITQTKSLILPLAFIAGGIVALVGGIISGINAVKKYKKMKNQEKEWANGS